jgi:hypothetical protein
MKSSLIGGSLINLNDVRLFLRILLVCGDNGAVVLVCLVLGKSF